jgi:hypothetical protein
MTTLMDSVRVDVPARAPVQPAAPLDHPVDPASKPRPAERTFAIESPNGYARTVVGTIEYLDDEARTYMVRTRTGDLVRVPLRDIANEHCGVDSYRSSELGLGSS